MKPADKTMKSSISFPIHLCLILVILQPCKPKLGRGSNDSHVQHPIAADSQVPILITAPLQAKFGVLYNGSVKDGTTISYQYRYNVSSEYVSELV